MLPRTFLLVLWLTPFSLGTPLSNTHPRHSTRQFIAKRSHSPQILDGQIALAVQATLRKFRNAPALLAGQGTSPGYTIPTSLQYTYDRASDYATNVSLLKSLSVSSASSSSDSSSSLRIAAAGSNTITSPLEDETNGVDDFEYYGQWLFGSQEQPLKIDFDTGSADLWVPVGCGNCQGLTQFLASTSTTFRNSSRPFAVRYGLGAVIGTIVQDAVAVGSFKVPDQIFGAVSSVSRNFDNEPNDGLIGLAFGTIANSHAPTFFENLIPQLAAPLFSVYLSRGNVQGSEFCFGCIDTSKAKDETVVWVPVSSKTYWTVDMTSVSVNDSPVPTNHLNALVDTGTSFLYLPTKIADAVYALIPGSAPAPDYGKGFYAYPCDTHVKVSFELGAQALAMNPLDMNLGRHTSDRTGTTCIGAIVGAAVNFAILGDSFCKNYVTVFDYSHDARVGFLESI